ncbi:histidine kinase dimerization/phospho-acceptor domain-containing protein [Variovorax sp. KK3]|uniref:histidine kinase dimerization/phospho-acceptor domain-containing protein n=1 Tax=Variovorax sp. KK3 TaxID=1855728 RepID=UPI00097C9190|nr:histidine kinase dimerization/phospho-acceptor domain-containing protein [Variovorax sp. KK3]
MTTQPDADKLVEPGGRANETEAAVLRRSLAEHGTHAMRLDHDLRTPLGTLAAALDLLTSTEARTDPGLRHETLCVMQRQLTRLGVLANELNALARGLQASSEAPAAKD